MHHSSYIQPLKHLNHHSPSKLYYSYRVGTRNQCINKKICQCNLGACKSAVVLWSFWRSIIAAVSRTVHPIWWKHSVPWQYAVRIFECLGIHSNKFSLTSRLPTSGSCVTYLIKPNFSGFFFIFWKDIFMFSQLYFLRKYCEHQQVKEKKYQYMKSN